MTVYTWSTMTQAQATSFTTTDGVVVDTGTAGNSGVAIGSATTTVTIGGKALIFLNPSLDADTVNTIGGGPGGTDEPVGFQFVDGSILAIHANGAGQGPNGVLSTGNDYYVSQSDTASALVDNIVGGAGNDTIYGGNGADVIGSTTNEAGNDSFFGNTGDDGIVGGLGNDSLFGGQGNDNLGGTGTAEGGDDSISGDIGNDIINGGDGNDSLFGFNDFDNIQGEAGNDSLSGNTANDTLDGGAGNDSVFGGKGDDILNSTATGGASAGNDSMNGNIGTDTVTGGGGNDSIFGGQDNDSLVGGAGADSISGDIGDDMISGGTNGTPSGGDTLVGGAGNDSFFFGQGDSGTSSTSGNIDQINDFVSGTDQIDFTGAGAGNVAAVAGGNYVELASQTTYGAALAAANANGSAYVAIQVGSDTFLFHDNLAVAGVDDVVKLVGVTIDGIQATDIV